jgi:integrase/recombinase XerD
VGSYISGCLRRGDGIRDEEVCPIKEEAVLMPTTLSTTIKHIYDKVPNPVNSQLIAEFHQFMKENGTSQRHQNNNLKAIIAFAEFLGTNKTFYQVKSKDQITCFLDTKMKTDSSDPEKRWITTWNDYLVRIKHFFRWLYNSKIKSDKDNSLCNVSFSSADWETPAFANIKAKRTKRLSPYDENEIWDLEELKKVIKYAPFKRNKAALALLWDLNGRNHEITLLKIKNIRMKERYGEGEIPNQAKTGSGPALLTFSFPYVRDWLNEHPFRNTPDARLICNLNNGAPIKPEALWTMMKQLRTRIHRLIETDAIANDSEKETLRVLLSTKKFNPYCLRHSSISHDSDYLPEYALKKKARWSMNSKQPSRYIKARMGNDLKRKILVENGIWTDDDNIKPKSTIADCARCSVVNCIDNKYCSSCSYPLTPSAFEEIKAAEELKLHTLQVKYENEMRSMREEIENKFQQILAKIDITTLK